MEFFENADLEDIDGLFEKAELNPESDFVSCEVEPNLLKIYYGIYWKVNDYIFYNDNVKEKTKKHTKVWIILSFFALAYLIFKENPDLPVNEWLEVVFMEIGILTCVGTLWFKDCFIVNKNIQTLYSFNEGLEKKYPEFGTSYKDARPLLSSKIFDPNLIDGGFYLNIMICIELVILVSLYMLKAEYIVFAVFILIFLLIDIAIVYVSKRSSSLAFKHEKALQKGELHHHIHNHKKK